MLEALLAKRSEFLAFVRGRVGDRAAAEDILQTAFERATLSASDLRSAERADAWFYSILRNAIIDHHRRGSARDRALERLASEETVPEDGQGRRICGCALTVLPELREEYRAMIQGVDIEGRPVEELAAALEITANNASVRLHRARRALRAKLLEFCVDCCSTESAEGRHDCYCRG